MKKPHRAPDKREPVPVLTGTPDEAMERLKAFTRRIIAVPKTELPIKRRKRKKD